MNTIQLECFRAVATHLNFSRAAERLNITQPAVSHQINSLEDELGTRLFARTSRTVRLTKAGVLFIGYADEMLKLTRLSRARLGQCREEQVQTLRIGCHDALELKLVEPVLQEMRKAEPELLPILRMAPFPAMENLLEDGGIHVMFALEAAARTGTSGGSLELARCPVVCVCTRDHPLARCGQPELARLKDYGRLAVSDPHHCAPAVFSLQSRAVAEHPSDQLLVLEGMDAVLTMVKAGFAFAIAPDLPQLRAPELCYLPLPELPALSLLALFRKRPSNPLLKRFLGRMKQTLQPPAGDE